MFVKETPRILTLDYKHDYNHFVFQTLMSVHPRPVRTEARAPTSSTVSCAHAQVDITKSTVRQVNQI